MSTSVLKDLPGKLDIKRHSPSILYILYQFEGVLVCIISVLLRILICVLSIVITILLRERERAGYFCVILLIGSCLYI